MHALISSFWQQWAMTKFEGCRLRREYIDMFYMDIWLMTVFGSFVVCRLKAEIEKLKLEFEESAAQERQTHSNEVKVKLVEGVWLFVYWQFLQTSLK